ncbi:hypothetical protein C5930_11095 [Cronobacter sakazakii]|uniref:DUF4145 domain-containing protein n=1 Tax=Cronobacter sakazakii TaxID=28141 RepID=UPI000CFBD1B3|nr:DUF4145 domain-containing protein [Cronobacter sakazakii]PQX95831.1 hypothetical protein C5930_11095 [Cronobacter sakazakii]PRO52798.1 hypothetical protein C5943_05555 [Cronobacter sakazakii]
MGLLSLNTTCPHCLRENAVIEGFAEKRVSETINYQVAFTCRSCDGGIIALIADVNHTRLGPYHKARSADPNVVIPNSHYSLLELYPKIENHTAPASSPDRAAKFFIESKDNFQRQRYETSVMLCRKVIDISTRVLLGEDSSKEQLSQRISMLHARGLITAQMKDWAHIVRMDSNGAIHTDEEFDASEAKQLINFTEVFLIYSFTLPAMVDFRREEKA